MSNDKTFYEMIKTQIRNTREMINANIGNNNTLSYFVNMTETLSNILQESNSELISRDKQILEQSRNNKIVNEYAERISILEDKIRELSMTPNQTEYEEEIKRLKNLIENEQHINKLSSIDAMRKNITTFFNKFHISTGIYDQPDTWEIADQELEEIIANARQEGRNESNEIIDGQLETLSKLTTVIRELRLEITPETKGFVYLQNSEAIDCYSGFKLKYFDQIKQYNIGDFVRYNNLVWIKINDPETTKLEESYKEIELFTDNNKLILMEVDSLIPCKVIHFDKKNQFYKVGDFIFYEQRYWKVTNIKDI